MKKYIILYIKKVLSVFSLVLYNISRNNRCNKEKLHNLKDKYKGERIFIVCNGPSLKAEDLDKISYLGAYSFACNRIDKIFPYTIWRPYFYTILDDTFQYTLLENMNNIPAKYKFFAVESYCVTKRVANSIYVKADRNPIYLKSPKFSTDIEEKLITLGTVTFSMIQIAKYMGFSEIYIIGCDNSYGKEIKKDGTIVDNGTQSYFMGVSDKANKKAIAATWQMNIAYDFAEQYSRNNGFRIYNATRGGHLESFERVDFDSLFC